MTRRTLLLLILISTIFGGRIVFSQTTNLAPGLFETVEIAQTETLRSFYFSETGFDNDLIFGQEYFAYANNAANKPLLFNDNLFTASLVFDGKRYNDVSLQYDVHTDEVIYTYFDLNINFFSSKIALNENMIGSFSLYRLGDTLNFYRITDSNLPVRFYEVPFQGKTKFAIKHYCSVYKDKSNYEYKIKQDFYLDPGSGFVKFRNKRQFLKAFGEEADVIRSLMDETNLRFIKKDKSCIVEILSEYNNYLSLPEENLR